MPIRSIFHTIACCRGVQALALPLGELSPQVTERGLQPFLPVRPLPTLSVLAALGHLSQGERQEVLGLSKIIAARRSPFKGEPGEALGI